MLEKLKQYWQLIVGGVVAVLSVAVLFYRSKAKSAEAIADNHEMLNKLNEGDKQLSANSGKLESEEAKRADIRKDVDDAKSDDSSDASDFLAKR